VASTALAAITSAAAVLGAGCAACGDNNKAKKDARSVPSDPVSIDHPSDAFELPACANKVSGTNVSLRRITPTNVGGLATLATSPPHDPRLFVLAASGVVWLFKDEIQVSVPFLDLSPDASGPVVSGDELGLLGLAFHPQYSANGLFYVYYTTGAVIDNTLRDVVARCSVLAGNPDRGDPASCQEILSIADPAANHNGGMMEFGADGYLYIGTGDGGGRNNIGRSEDATLLLGKMLRIDVDHPANGKAYGIPADNPFAQGGGAPEVFMLGLRNPWRWSFDRANGDLWLGDVGADTVEELDVLHPTQQPRADLGWSTYEGSNCFTPPCDPTGKVFPKNERLHSAGWNAIIGGQVYRGTCYPDLVGTYFYGDLASGVLAEAKLASDDTLTITDVPGLHGLTSLHADARGELYLTEVHGQVYHLEVSASRGP
jgi:glucose/arabinose dehydrogenase